MHLFNLIQILVHFPSPLHVQASQSESVSTSQCLKLIFCQVAIIIIYVPLVQTILYQNSKGIENYSYLRKCYLLG